MTSAGGQLGAVAFRDLGDGRGLWIYPNLFTWRLALGPIADTMGYTEHWCYAREHFGDFLRVEAAMNAWNPETETEPSGWVRHPKTGRRRFPDGDPATEVVSW